MKKKKILFHSNNSRAFTGFGKNCKNVLKYLASTNKYEIVELANGAPYDHPSLNTYPWKCVGSLPSDPAKIEQLNKDPSLAKKAGYGGELIDQIIKEERPDFYIGAEDIWAFENYEKRPWWNKINCMIWTTLDSLPILPLAVKMAPEVKHYYVWASFAEKALSEIGHTHVKTLRGSVETKNFLKLTEDKRKSLRDRFNIPQDNFIIGFVFRNQLRKSVPNLLDGFKIFKKENPQSNAKLLLHTHWSEGWDIKRLCEEKEIDLENILTTYFCKSCKNYEIKTFSGTNLNCNICGAQNSQDTTSVSHGVSEKQLNEIYNLMDVYCHPFTSGGQEIPLQEAKLNELITLTTNYSCGEDNCTPESGGLPLDWTEYREPGTQFIKATTCPKSIALNLKKVFEMPAEERERLGKISRQFVFDNFSSEKIGNQLEEIIDNANYEEWDFDFSIPENNPNYNPPQIESNSDWLIDLYKNILNRDVDDEDEGHKYWMTEFKKGAKREAILNYFKSVALKENAENQRKELESLFDNNGRKKLLFVCSGGNKDVLNSTSLLNSLSESVENCDIYYSCNEKSIELIEQNPLIYKCIPYREEFGNEIFMIGGFNKKKLVDFYVNSSSTTVSSVNYLSNPSKEFNVFKT